MFSNVKLAFLPKNSTSRSQPIDAGIIKAWKVKTKRKILRYICSQVDSNNKASEIVKSVHLLQAIQWGKQSWDEVDQETVQKCFKKVGLSPDEVDMEEGIDDPFEGEDMMSLEELCAKLGTTETVTAQEFSLVLTTKSLRALKPSTFLNRLGVQNWGEIFWKRTKPTALNHQPKRARWMKRVTKSLTAVWRNHPRNQVQKPARWYCSYRNLLTLVDTKSCRMHCLRCRTYYSTWSSMRRKSNQLSAIIFIHMFNH